MIKLVVEIFDDGAISWTRPATQAEIDAAASQQMQDDAEAGKAIREWFAKLSGYAAEAKMVIQLFRYDSQHIKEAHWFVCASNPYGFNANDGKSQPDCPELRDALIAAGLLPAKQVTK